MSVIKKQITDLPGGDIKDVEEGKIIAYEGPKSDGVEYHVVTGSSEMNGTEYVDTYSFTGQVGASFEPYTDVEVIGEVKEAFLSVFKKAV
jgi:hypothetical protein